MAKDAIANLLLDAGETDAAARMVSAALARLTPVRRKGLVLLIGNPSADTGAWDRMVARAESAEADVANPRLILDHARAE